MKTLYFTITYYVGYEVDDVRHINIALHPNAEDISRLTLIACCEIANLIEITALPEAAVDVYKRACEYAESVLNTFSIDKTELTHELSRWLREQPNEWIV